MSTQISRFLGVGVFNTVLGYAVIFACMYALGMSPAVSNAIGYAIGLVISFTLSRSFTFRSAGRPSVEAIRFVVAFAIAYGANLLALLMLTQMFSVHAGLSQVLAGIIYVVVSYLLNARFVFRKSVRGAP